MIEYDTHWTKNSLETFLHFGKRASHKNDQVHFKKSLLTIIWVAWHYLARIGFGLHIPYWGISNGERSEAGNEEKSYILVETHIYSLLFCFPSYIAIVYWNMAAGPVSERNQGKSHAYENLP